MSEAYPQTRGADQDGLDALRELKRKSFIEFEVGQGVKITENGTVALRALL